MSDPVWLGIIAGLVTIAQSALTVWSGKKTQAKVADVHTLVNNRSTQQDEKIASLKQEVGRLNENSTNSTPETGGSVNMQHGQVIVPSREPEVKG